MAKFGIEATNISPASSRPYTSPGVETRTPTINEGVAKAKMVGELGGMALDAYKGYQIADLEKEQEKVVSDYLDSKKNPQRAADASAEAAGASIAIDQLWKKAETTGDVSAEDFSPIEKSHQASLSKLKSAVDTGVMSPAQFEARVLATTRQAVTRNPGLYPELLQHSKKMLELSGIQQTLKFDQAQIESQEKLAAQEENRWQEAAFSMGIDKRDPSWRAQVFHNKQQENAWETAKKASEGNKAVIEGIVTEPKLFSSIADGARVSLVSRLTSILNDPSLDAKSKELTIQAESGRIMSEFQSMFKTSAGLPQVTSTMSQFKELVSSYSQAASGKLDSEALTNRVTVLTKSAELKLGMQEQKAVLDILGKLPPEVLNHLMFAAPSDGKPAALQPWLKGITDAVASKGFGELPITTSKDKAIVTSSVGAIMDEAKVSSDGVAKLSGVFESFHKEMYNQEKDAKTRVYWGDTFVRSLAGKGSNESVLKLDPSQRTQAIGDVREYLDTYASFIKGSKRYADGPAAGKDIVRPADLVIDALDDGTLVFKSGYDRKAADDMNFAFGNRINNGVKALSNLQGHGDQKLIVQNKDFIKVLANMMGVGPNDQISVGKIKGVPVEGVKPQRRATDGPSSFPSVSPELQTARDAQATGIRKQEGVSPAEVAALEKEIRRKGIDYTAKKILIREWELNTGQVWK